MTLKTPDLWAPIALSPQPQGSYLHLILLSCPYLKMGGKEEEILYVFKLLIISTRESSTFLGPLPTFPTGFGPFQASVCVWFPWDPEHHKALPSVTASWRKSDDKQETSHLPTSPEGSAGAWIFTPGNIIKVLLYKMSMITLISWIKFFSRLYCFQEFRLKEITVLYFQNRVPPNLAPVLSPDHSDLLIDCPNARLQTNK